MPRFKMLTNWQFRTADQGGTVRTFQQGQRIDLEEEDPLVFRFRQNPTLVEEITEEAPKTDPEEDLTPAQKAARTRAANKAAAAEEGGGDNGETL